MYPSYKAGNVPPDPNFLRGEAGIVHYSYDVGADVLYLSYDKPSPAICDEIHPGVLLRRGLLNLVVGVTLISLEVMELHSAIATFQQVGDVPQELIAFMDTHVGRMQIQMFGESYVTR